MNEILTESFCERCGTRYTFQSTVPRRRPMKGLRVVGRGLKNFVMTDGSSLEEAMAEARGDEDRAVSSQQIEAFHQAFNFCMNCRQYTCGNCWNGPENLCLTCAPDLSREIPPAPFEPVAYPPLQLAQNGAPTGSLPPSIDDVEAWPEVDLTRLESVVGGTNGSGVDASSPDVLAVAEAETASPAYEAPFPYAAEAVAEADVEGPEVVVEAAEATVAEPLVRDVADVWLEPEFAPVAPIEPRAAEPVIVESIQAESGDRLADEPLVETGEPAFAEVEPGAIAAGADEQDITSGEEADASALPRVAPRSAISGPASPASVEERAAAAAAATSELLGRFRPGQSLDAAIEEYERRQGDEQPTATDVAAEAGVAAETEVSEPVAAEPDISEPVAAVAEADLAVAGQPQIEEPVTAVGADVTEPVGDDVEVDWRAALGLAVLADELVADEPAVEEPVTATVEAETAAEPVGAEADETDVDWQVVPALSVAAEPVAEVEPVAPEPEPEPVAAEPEPEPVAASQERRDDRVEIPTWQIVAPDNGALPTAPTTPMPTPTQPGESPVWPVAAQADPQWPTAPFLQSPQSIARSNDALWASSVAVVQETGGGIQSCVSCGLSLSATARFCRRCGTRQQ